MPALSATVLPELAAVRLEGSGLDAGPVVITRTDRNGEATVRQLPGQETSAGLLSVVDYEPALAGPVLYELEAAGGLLSATVDLGGTAAPIVTVPVRPQLRAQVESLTGYQETSTSGTVRLPVLEATGPVLILRPMLAAEGSMTFRASSFANANALRSVVSGADVVLVRQPEFTGLDGYVAVQAVSVSPVDEELDPIPWAVQLTYTAASSPAGGLAGAAGWTVADVTALGVTVADVPALFPTVYALTVGPT